MLPSVVRAAYNLFDAKSLFGEGYRGLIAGDQVGKIPIFNVLTRGGTIWASAPFAMCHRRRQCG